MQYGPLCKACGHPTRMLVGREWREIPCACLDTPGDPPHHHTGPGPAPWERPSGSHHERVNRPPVARLVRERLAAAREKAQGR